MKLHKALVAASVAALALMGCAPGGEGSAISASQIGGESPSALSSAAPVIDGATLRGYMAYDYDIAESAAALASRLPYAFLAEVVGWSDGYSVLEHVEESGLAVASRTALLEVKVTESFAGTPVPRGSTVYVDFARGVENVAADGSTDPRTSGAIPVEALRLAAPAGSRFLFVGYPGVDPADQIYAEYITVEGAGVGLPEGATVVTPHPQGMLFETAGGDFVSARTGDADVRGWGGSFDALLSELRAMGK